MQSPESAASSRRYLIEASWLKGKAKAAPPAVSYKMK
jgi:hypothetical protein